MIQVRLLVTSSVPLAIGATAEASIIPFGSSLTFGNTNAPDTYSATTTLSSTLVLMDGGAVEIWQEQVPTGSGGRLLHHGWRAAGRQTAMPTGTS